MHAQQAQETSRSKSFRTRETIPLQSLVAPGALVASGTGKRTDVQPSLQLPQHNLGGASRRVGESTISLQEASFAVQESARSFSDLDRVAPAFLSRQCPRNPPA